MPCLPEHKIAPEWSRIVAGEAVGTRGDGAAVGASGTGAGEETVAGLSAGTSSSSQDGESAPDGAATIDAIQEGEMLQNASRPNFLGDLLHAPTAPPHSPDSLRCAQVQQVPVRSKAAP